MEKSEIVIVDWNKRSNFSLLNAEPFFERSYSTGLEGRGFIHVRHPTCEYPEHFCLQHSVLVHLQPKYTSVRRIGDATQSENVSFGDVAIIPARINHWEKIESPISELIILTIEPDVLTRLARERISINWVELLPTFAQPNLLIQSIALDIKAEFDSGKYDRRYVESLFNALLMHLLRHYCVKENQFEPSNGGLPSHKLKQALQYIHQNLDGNIKINDIAMLLGISQYYFCRLFRESTGIAPYRYVIQQRVSKAKQLIEEDKLSLLDVAIECGFSSQSQMTHHFRRLVGVTPKVYRNQL
ncbi:MAG: AraC family transcriptional regulator [Cyanobacteria bacterium J06621_12]